MSVHCRILLFSAIFLWPVAASVLAHQDRIIQLDGRKLVGLPQKYQPAELDLDGFRIRIRGRSEDFSPWLKSLFQQPHELQLSASWYHERWVLPPYLSLRIQPRAKHLSYHILIDLDAVRVIKAEVVRKESKTTTRFVPLALSDHRISKVAPAR